MRASPLFWKLLAGYGLIILPTLAVSGEIATDAIELTAIETEDARLRTTVELTLRAAKEWLRRPEDAAGQRVTQRLREIDRAAGLRLTLLDAGGRILADTLPVPARNAIASGRTEIVEAAASGVGRAVRRSVVDGSTMAFFAVRVDGDAGPLGFVRAGAERGPWLDRASQVRNGFVIAAVVALLAAAAIAALQARALDRTLGQLRDSAAALARGEYRRVPPTGEGTGFDEVAGALDRIAAHSRGRLESLASDRNQVVAILSVMVEGVVTIDAGGSIMHMNAAAARILGTQALSSAGRRILEVTRVREVHQVLDEVLRTGREAHGEVQVVQPPRDRFVEMHASPLRDANGAVAGAVALLHDVTELRRLEAIRREFVANVSHELKTPITAIRGMVETVLDDPQMDPGFRDRFLSRIKEQSHRLSTLVTDLLTLSRLESEQHVGEMIDLDLRGVVRDTVHGLAQQAEDKSIRVHVDVPAGPVRILGEAEALRLLVGNLLDNAIKYTPANGNVWLRLVQRDRHAEILVTDDGIGIERKHLDRIFQRFYRVDKARSRELGGTGLGLSIVKHICLAHHGDVAVESTPGEGASFRVTLPLA